MSFDPVIIKAQNPIRLTLERRYGLVFKKISGEWYALCPFHEDSNPSLSVNETKEVFICRACNVGGDVISFVMKKENVDFAKACELLGGTPGEQWHPPESKPEPEKKTGFDWAQWIKTHEPDEVYDYRDQFGNVVYQACRYEHADNSEKGYEKTFRQRRPTPEGGWIWNMQGVALVLYRLPELMSSGPCQIVNICEGEKDCNTLADLGFIATTNVMGAGKWKDGYSEFLRDRNVAVWPDQDKAGKAHAKEVFDSVSKFARSVRIVNPPEPFKDVTDWTWAVPGSDHEMASLIQERIDAALPYFKGVEVPVYTMEEMESVYRKMAQDSQTTMFQLSSWIPSLQPHVRGLVPGELVVFLGETGIGKTALLQNLAINASPLTTLLFEIELPTELTFERFVAAAHNRQCRVLFDLYASGNSYNWREQNKLGHIYVCSRSSITPEEIEQIIIRSELKIGNKPVLVLIDYIGLVRSLSKSRYERVSDVAERLKEIAKSTHTIVVIASQVARKGDNEGPEIHLQDGKDSGSIENSCGIVIGAWRDGKDASLLNIRVLKNTKGKASPVIKCNFNGETMRITERSPIDDNDVPPHFEPPTQSGLPYNDA